MNRLPANRETGAPAVVWVVNDAWADGRAGSLQCGLRALPPEITGVVVHAVDHPDVRPETVAALVAAHQATDAGVPAAPTLVPRKPAEPSIVLPVYRDHRGHPVLLARSVWPEVFALAADDSLRTVVHRDPTRLRDIEVNDPGIHRNRNEREASDITPASHPQKGER